MPIYEYECKSCNKVIEVMQRMTDDPLATCPVCSGAVQKMVSMSSFQLKGGGWYSEGYSSTASSGSGGKAVSASSSSSDSKSSASSEKSCSSPCAAGACAST